MLHQNQDLNQHQHHNNDVATETTDAVEAADFSFLQMMPMSMDKIDFKPLVNVNTLPESFTTFLNMNLPPQSQLQPQPHLPRGTQTEQLSTETLIADIHSHPPNHAFRPPHVDIRREAQRIVKLAHRNKNLPIPMPMSMSISMSKPMSMGGEDGNLQEERAKVREFRAKLLKKLKLQLKQKPTVRKNSKRGNSKRQSNNKCGRTKLSATTTNIDIDSTTATATATATTSAKMIGRPLTPQTRVRLTLVPNLPTLYSMLVTETLTPDDAALAFKPGFNGNGNGSGSSLYREMKSKFRVLKRGTMPDADAFEELLVNEAVDWRFKTSTATAIATATPNTVTEISSPLSPEGDRASFGGGVFPGKTQAVTFLDVDQDQDLDLDLDQDQISDVEVGCDDSNSNTLCKRLKLLPSIDTAYGHAIGLERDGVPVYTSVATAVREVFGINEFTLLRITRAAAFEKTGSIVLKMETAKPGDAWLDDDEFDMRLLYRLYSENEVNGEETAENDNENEEEPPSPQPFGTATDPITTTFLKKKVARPRYKCNMRIYVVPRCSDAVLYTRESMLRRDIVNGTLDLSGTGTGHRSAVADGRLVLTAFDYVPLLREMGVLE
jgi:hypothetical protein